MEQLTIAPQPHSSPTTNVILFGEPGVGKSAVVNLIARRTVAMVPSGTRGCALQSTRYHVPIDDMNLCIYETVGLEEPEIRRSGYPAALEKAHDFVNKLGAIGGVHLLLFCMRANKNKLTATMQSNYRLFSEVVFPTKVPMAFVITGLEGEAEMEDWWMKNKAALEFYGLRSGGHACITATVTDRTPHHYHNFMVSQTKIRELLKSCCLKTPASLPEPRDWFLYFGNGMLQFGEKQWKPTQADVMHTLKRLKLDPQTAQRFLDMMERRDAQLSSRDGAVGPQGPAPARVKHRDSEGKVDPPKVNMTPKSRDWDSGTRGSGPQRAGVVEIAGRGHALYPGKRDNDPLRTMTDERMAHSQCRYPNVAGEEDKSRKWDDGPRWEEAGKIKAEPRKVNTPYVKSDTGVSMEDIRSNFLHDLTGHVTITDEHPLASGSYGEIYRGKLRTSGRSSDVAIKVYKMYSQRDEAFPEWMRRFHREIIVWSKLEHQNILQLFGTIRDHNMHPEIPAMGLTAANRLSLVNDVAHGLQYLHSQHVVHGDLSGTNVLVRVDGSACIADFGLSTLLTMVYGSAFASSCRDKGTVRWMAPELLDPNNPATTPTPRSDVYSFGSIMLQILTGDVPYCHLSHDAQVIYAISKGTRPDRSSHRVVTNGRWRFIEKCWSAGEERPSSDEIVEFTKRELAESAAPQF